ncbi:hypothetical protein CI109_103655 [Kwoniella shandongensis]|uniref:GH18 domain-containing protein n=1 Tax=Kwoniella shandongensis TaxID=1734106 RepID=A0A5M6C8Z4_9TREE|nr:uncharacterized protein CI109_000652 [Kwoniella shandongensis]KAA5531080.1 hypothetical protein CI109_000652 [Kwoniella shandongensis]
MSISGAFWALLAFSALVSAAPYAERTTCGSKLVSSSKHKGGGEIGQWAGYRSVGYYTNWALYDPQDFFVTNITASEYTHLLYSFANVDGVNGTVFLTDEYADLQYEYPGDDEDESCNNLYGNLKQLYLMKEQNRNLKVMLSIGGAGYSTNFANITDSDWRQTFAKTAVALVHNLGFDGLDIDFVDLMRILREHLNKAAEEDCADHYLLSWAASCGESGWGGLDVPGMDQYLDFWNLMAYDFSGEWTDKALPASNLYPDGNPANDVGASGSQCADHYRISGVNPRKLNLGMPLYGTAFNGTQGMYTNWTDLGDGDWDQPGNYDDKHLPLPGETVVYNKTLGASWSVNNATGHIVSFDTPTVALQKAEYVLDNQLGGMMYWSVDQDYSRPQTRGRLNAPMIPAHWEHTHGAARKKLYGHHKGAPWPLPAELSPIRRDVHSREKRSDAVPDAAALVVEKRWDDGSIDTNVGESLVDVVLTAFTNFGGPLDSSQNNLHYPHSEYDNLRNGFH